MRTLVLAAILAVSVPSVGLSASKTNHAARIIPKYVGEVNERNVERVLNMIGDHQDKIVGLQVMFDATPRGAQAANGYTADKDDGRLFVVSYGTLESPGIEMVVPKDEANYQHGGYVLDGFYLVKTGGMHQGTISYGLEKVDEATVLLSTKYRVVEQIVQPNRR